MHILNLLLILFVPIGFAFCFFLDSLTLCARIGGFILSKNASGSYFTQIILVGSRFAVVILFPAAALLVDRGSSTEFMYKVFSYGAITGSLILIVLYTLRFKIVVVFAKLIGIFLADDDKSSKSSVIDSVERIDRFIRNSRVSLNSFLSYRYLIIAAMAVTMINGLGLSIPMILSTSSESYQTTISHLGPIINVFATLINIAYIEGKLTRALEKNDSITAMNIAEVLICSRAFSLMLLGIMYLILASGVNIV
jgi:hypothetical protein